MTVTAGQIAQIRRMTNEPTTAVYDDALITTIVEGCAIPDPAGVEPTETAWVATYDLNAAAAIIWDEKAAAFSDKFDFDADGGSYKRSQLMAHATKMANKYRSRRAISPVRLVKYPDEHLTSELFDDPNV